MSHIMSVKKISTGAADISNRRCSFSFFYKFLHCTDSQPSACCQHDISNYRAPQALTVNEVTARAVSTRDICCSFLTLLVTMTFHLRGWKLAHQLFLPCWTFMTIFVFFTLFYFKLEACTTQMDKQTDRRTGKACNAAYGMTA